MTEEQNEILACWDRHRSERPDIHPHDITMLVVAEIQTASTADVVQALTDRMRDHKLMAGSSNAI